jgi:hypothetical protein
MKKFAYEFAELLEGVLPRPPSPTGSRMSSTRSVAPSFASRRTGQTLSSPTRSLAPLPPRVAPRPPPSSTSGAWK